MKFAVTIVSPPGYPHSEAFAEIAETVHHGLRGLGHESVLTRALTHDKRRRSIIFGANLLAGLKLEPPPGAVLYNLEQVQAGSAWMTPALLDLFRRFPVWDYSQGNVEQLVALGLPRPTLLPIGYAKELTRIEAAPVEDIDVLFYGSINARRRQVLEALLAQGLKVEVLYGVYGAARDAVIARAKVVLNLHFYEAKIFEAVRVSYLLANGRAVVSERGAVAAEEAAFEPGVCFAPYAALVEHCTRLVHDEPERRRLGQAGLQLMSGRSEQAYLRAALERPQGAAA
jgi:hypothetical protein